jgi:hypothetical protein
MALASSGPTLSVSHVLSNILLRGECNDASFESHDVIQAFFDYDFDLCPIIFIVSSLHRRHSQPFSSILFDPHLHKMSN